MTRATATFHGRTIADTDNFEFVEGNVYFPPSSVDKSVLTPTAHSTYCPWKGDASYYNIAVDGQTADNAAWYYPKPISDRAEKLKDYVAFYKSKVEVVQH